LDKNGKIPVIASPPPQPSALPTTEMNVGYFSKELWDFIKTIRGPCASKIEGDIIPPCTIKSNYQIEDIIVKTGCTEEVIH
jgi:hypothetical protein